MQPSLRVAVTDYHPTARVSDRLPSGASYRVSYSKKQSWHGDRWWVSMQTYDARHAYVYLIEVFARQPLRFGVECLRRDLRWLYPLSGAFTLHDRDGRKTLQLTADEHIRVLSGAGSHEVAVPSGRHLLFAFVLDWGWTRRYARNALEYLRTPVPVPITPAIRGHLLTLANLSQRERLLMDAEIYWPIARITHHTRQLYEEREADAQPIPAGLQLARATRNYIHDTVRMGSSPFIVAEIAAHFGVTADYLSRVYKKHYGQSVQSYLMRQRLTEAFRLLAEEGLPVTTVAYRMEFTDLSAFGKLFRKHFKHPPSAVRKKGGRTNDA